MIGLYHLFRKALCSRERRLKIYLVLLAITLILYLQPFRLGIVLGNSMEPTLNNADLFLLEVKKISPQDLKVGDIVAVKVDGLILVKRVYALPGQKVKKVPGKGDNLYFWLSPWWLKKNAYEVPEGHILVIGDNLDDSMDSRDFGPIPLEDVVGKVVLPQVARPSYIRYPSS